MELGLLSLLSVLFGVAILGLVMARKVGLPGLVGMLLMGFVLRLLAGKFGWVVFEDGMVDDLAKIGVTFLLFLLGVEFSIKSLARFRVLSFLGAGVQIVLTTLLGVGILNLLGIGGPVGLVLALGLSLSSTAVVVKLLSERRATQTLSGRIMVGWLLVQDLAVIPILLLLPFLAGEGSGGGVSFLALGLLLTAVLVLGLVLGKVFDFLAQIGESELLILAAAMLGLGLGWLFEWAGLSLALGGFVAGMLLSESSEKHEIFAKLSPLRDLFSSIFFLSLGILIDPVALISSWQLVFLLVGLFGLIKFFLVLLILLVWRVHLRVGVAVGLGLFEAGEFAFVIGQMARDEGALSPYYLTVMTSVVVLSMVVLPLLTLGEERFYQVIKWLMKRLKMESLVSLSNKKSIHLSELGLHDHVVLLGYGRVGSLIGERLIKRLKKDKLVIVDYDLKVVNQMIGKGIPALFGDSQEVEILEEARVSQAKIVVVAIPEINEAKRVIRLIREQNKQAFILARAHRHGEVEELKRIGANRVVLVEESVGRLMFSYVKDKL